MKYMAFEYENITYIIETDRINPGKALMIKNAIVKRTGNWLLTIQEIMARGFTFDRIDRKELCVNLIGCISRYNIGNNDFVLL